VMVMGFGVGHEAIAACTEHRRDYFQRCRPREEAMKGIRGGRGGGGGGGLLRMQQKAAKVSRSYRCLYEAAEGLFPTLQAHREGAMKGGRGSGGNEDGS
jgi:hypothetical protein